MSGTLCAAAAISRMTVSMVPSTGSLTARYALVAPSASASLKSAVVSSSERAPYVADAAHDLRQDDARVAARAHERPLGDGGGDRRHALGVAVLQLFEDGAHGEREVGAGVTVRDGIHVEVVDDVALGLEGVKRAWMTVMAAERTLNLAGPRRAR